MGHDHRAGLFGFCVIKSHSWWGFFFLCSFGVKTNEAGRKRNVSSPRDERMEHFPLADGSDAAIASLTVARVYR